MKAFFTILLLAASCFGANFYASTSGSGSTCSLASPCSLRTALANQANMGTGDTLFIRGGTYYGKFEATLDGGTVRSYPGEWAVLDGNLTTTLSGNIDSSVTTFDVATTDGMFSGLVLTINDEDMQASVVDSNTVSVVRGWNGTTAASHTAGATVYHKGSSILNIIGSSTTYRDFEVMSTSTFRDETANWAASARGAGVTITGSSDGNSLIGLIIHDTSNGIFIGSSTSNTETSECLVFNNGVILADGGEAGMGIYSENASGYSRVYRNVMVNNWNFNFQFYGVSGPYVGGDHQYNVFANAGSFAGDSTRNFNGIIGPNASRTVSVSVTNSHFFQPMDAVGGLAVYLGYGAGITTATFNNNYVVGGPAGLEINDVTTLNGTGNNFYLDSVAFGYTEIFYHPLTLPNGTFNSNTYHKASGRDYFGAQSVGYFQFSTWKTNTGFDAASTQTAIDMPDTVVPIAYSYTPGRAVYVIYTPSGASSVNINLSSSGLVNGQTYTVRNAFDYFGSSVATGTYNSSSPTISLAMTSLDNVTTPTGWANTPQTTAPDLAVAIVVPGDQQARVKIQGGKAKGVKL